MTSVSVGLVALGIGLLAVGLVGDSIGWWESRPFLTNVISTLTGACFGLPIALILLRRAAETRDAEVAAQRDATESALLSERMRSCVSRIEHCWDDVKVPDGRAADIGWATLVADVTNLSEVLTAADEPQPQIEAAVRPLTKRFRRVGLGNVHVAVDEIHQDWIRLKDLAGAGVVLRDWEAGWAESRVVDVRTFGDILEGFSRRSSHSWCDFFARLPDEDVVDASSLKEIRSNVRLALNFLYDTGTILVRLRGADALPPFWKTAIVTYNQLLQRQYGSVVALDTRVPSAEDAPDGSE